MSLSEDSLDCNTCGACCAYSPDWAELRTERDRGPDGPEAGWRTDDGYVRWSRGRCAALRGEVGVCTSCTIYARRPEPCRACEPGSPSCLVARRSRALWVPPEASTMEFVGAADGPTRRARLRPR